MNAPKTYFSTELHTNQQALRCRLDDLFTAPRRRGVFPLVCALLLVSMLGSLVACNTPSAPTVSAPLPTVSLPDLPVTEENRDARTLYAQVLTTLLDENLLPGEINDPAGYTGTVAEREAMTENQFAVCDVDGDGREELVIQYITANMVAGMQALIYDTDENGRLHLQFSEFPNLTFYDNGAIQAGWSHNQGLAGGFWPYTLYVYDPESDLYRDVGSVDAWSRDYQPQNYPADTDTSGTGFVYYVYRDMGTEYGLLSPVDESEYLQWREEYLAGAAELELPWQSLTAEHIQTLTAAG
ncbi:hypothetical protein [uncultured Intestinimonas sp.]|uniref:hypothetical protein n=1 Tax=uncultured Intestinimonas sp. TaxID=1689265 RepID=UPI0025E9253D|nr:hypothetical protein [uncultured Intestinimonas sp.]